MQGIIKINTKYIKENTSYQITDYYFKLIKIIYESNKSLKQFIQY